MTELVRFQTRARTVDHLGREQIADCPTAISELWKNSYDAYSRTSDLHLFDGEHVVACLCDDGHGMTRDEFVEKWLVIGTESKFAGGLSSELDRNGLKFRRRQGKKGIGRLSAGYLANLLLLVTKRGGHDFVASLIDWRIFENPYLVLDDIRLPLTTFSDRDELFDEIPALFDRLMSNLWGDPEDDSHAKRVATAWESFEEAEKKSTEYQLLGIDTTKEKIEKTLLEEPFSERHIAEWGVWSGGSEQGTALLMTRLIPELSVQISGAKSSVSQKSITNFRDTLWNFVDPFSSLSEQESGFKIEDFSTSVVRWKGDIREPIIEGATGFEAHAVNNLEHIIDGRVDDDGVFTGRVKAFGKWLGDEVVIRPSEAAPKRSNTKVGEFDFYSATMEFTPGKTTHSAEEHSNLKALIEQYSGLMVFRDGFRVMPYGRPDSDYFEIEQRRSKNAGREFWNHRQILGRIAISNHGNPNLKDKAGREGIIDNTASKAFRSIVVNILKTAARHYFGSASKIRKDVLPTLKNAYDEKKRLEENERLLTQKRRNFRRALSSNVEDLDSLLEEVSEFSGTCNLASGTATEAELMSIQE